MALALHLTGSETYTVISATGTSFDGFVILIAEQTQANGFQARSSSFMCRYFDLSTIHEALCELHGEMGGTDMETSASSPDENVPGEAIK